MKSRSYFKTVNLAMDVLESFSPHHESMSVSEIATTLGISKSATSKMLSTLASRSMVTKSEIDGTYSIGTKILALASLVKTELRIIAKPYLLKLCKETNESISLFVIENNERRCLDQIEGNHEIRLRPRVGSNFPLYAGSPSKALLAFLPRYKRDELLKQRVPRKDESNITFNREKFEAELESVRQNGFAVSIGERTADVGSVSAPIRDRSGTVIAALSIAAPMTRLNSTKIRKYSKLVVATADEISSQLGY